VHSRAPDGRSLAPAELTADRLRVTTAFGNDNRLTYTYGSAAAHVAVDPGTGDVELLDCLVVEDVGRIEPRRLFRTGSTALDKAGNGDAVVAPIGLLALQRALLLPAELGEAAFEGEAESRRARSCGQILPTRRSLRWVESAC
jgi:hypothetical protein